MSRELGRSQALYCPDHAGEGRAAALVRVACPRHEHCQAREICCAAEGCAVRVWDGGCVVHRVRHPRKLCWREYVEQVAEMLRQLGRPVMAQRLLECAAWASRAKCSKCEADPARVRIIASCSGRVCPFCARRASQKLTRRVTAAMELVRELVRARLPALAEQCAREVSAATGRVEHWTERAAAARARYERAGGAVTSARARASLARAEKYLATAENDRVRWVRWGLAARDLEGWGWRSITLGRVWDPSAKSQRGVEPVRGRVSGLWRQWAACWKELRIAGVAAATPRMEMSGTGFVHLHALYFGPWANVRPRLTGPNGERTRAARKAAREARVRELSGAELEQARTEHAARQEAWLDRVQRAVEPRAGASHVELLHGGRGGVKEHAKYTCKSISPLSVGWIAGERRVVAHPADLAEWQVATDRRQLVRHCGTMRDAMRLVVGAEKKQRDPPCCAHCKALLAPTWAEMKWETPQRTEALARAMRDRWKAHLSPDGASACADEWAKTVTLEGESFVPRVVGTASEG